VSGLSDKQTLSIDEASARINIWEGAVRSGKSVGANFSWFNHIRHAPPSGELVMMGRTKETIARNVINVLKDPLLYGALAKTVAYTDGANSATILGRQVHVLGANDIQSEAKVRGMTVAGALVDEATILPESTFQQLVARMSVRGAKLYATTNPDGPNHWLKRDWLDRPDPDIRSWHFTLDDNPFLDPSYVAYLRRQYTGLWRKRFVDGLWVLAEGAIYDMFDLDVHTLEPQDLPFIERWLCVGVDYGTSNPCHAVLLGVGVDKRLYVLAEYRHDSRTAHRQMTDAEYSAALRAWLPTIPIPGTEYTGPEVEYIVVDPSAASFRAQLQRDGMASWAALNDVLDGIRTVATLLSNDQLRISRACPHLIGELAGYSWDAAAQKLGEDKPLKVNDHGADALRYGLYTTRNAWEGTLRRPLAAVS
jgi:PBSX family phage terminase large subunit